MVEPRTIVLDQQTGIRIGVAAAIAVGAVYLGMDYGALKAKVESLETQQKTVWTRLRELQ